MQHLSFNGFDVRFFQISDAVYLITADVNKAFGFIGENTSADNASMSLHEIDMGIPISWEDNKLPMNTLVIEFVKLIRVVIRSTKPEALATSEALVQMLTKAFFQNLSKPTNIPALPAATDTDRVQKLATAAANRYQPSDIPKDTINLPGWLTVSEMLIELLSLIHI
jgi:hypothetical protein